MPVLKINDEGKISRLAAESGEMLLDILRYHNYGIYSPCGGNGTCGKCKVYIRNMGYATSCIYPIEEDIEIILPDRFESSILAAQYEHTKEVVFSPGEAAGLSQDPRGIAIDLGTTTLVFHLVDLKSGFLLASRTEMNPQTGYGADVISRINYCMMHPEGLKTLQSKLMDVINKQIRCFCDGFGMVRNDIVRIVISGNTTMLHILCGIHPEPLAFYPFKPVFTDSKTLDPGNPGWQCHPKAVVETLPSLSAYIGADILAGMATLQLPSGHRNALFIDVGTNGEMALLTPGKIYCCAAAAGPAFEGAKIEHGMGAVNGAISAFQGRDDFCVIGGAKPMGICGSGLIDMIHFMLKNGVLDNDGYLETPYPVVSAEKSGLSKDIVVTPQDIREVQLAKSAISAGIRLLTRRGGLTLDEVDAVYIAGGFGNHIRAESAVGIGLFPENLYGKIIPVGNTSGTGALLAVQSTHFLADIAGIRERSVVFELTEDERFLTEFADNMDFPIGRG